jgi:hypothetical protein
MFKSLFKDIEGTIYSALLRERIVTMMEMTMNDIRENPEKWANSFVNPSMYQELDAIIEYNLGFKND